MTLNALSGLLREASSFQRIQKAMEAKCTWSRLQLTEDATPFTLATLSNELANPMMIITPRPEDARNLYEQLKVWSCEKNQISLFPETEALPFERLISDHHAIQQRLNTLSNLLISSNTSPIVVASITAISQKTISRARFDSNNHSLRIGDKVVMSEIQKAWQHMGYKFEPQATVAGQASRRGGILDVFPIDSITPVRIELWGDEIVSIRLFDPTTQRSLKQVDSVTITAAQETLPGLPENKKIRDLGNSINLSNCTETMRQRISKELDLVLNGEEVEDIYFYAGLLNHGSLFDYFPSHGIVVMYKPSGIKEAACNNDTRAQELRKVKEGRGELPLHFPSCQVRWAKIENLIKQRGRRLDISPWDATELRDQHKFTLPFTSLSGRYGNTKVFVEEAEKLVKDGHRIVATTSTPKRLVEILTESGVSVNLIQTMTKTPDPGTVTVLNTPSAGLKEGFALSVDNRKLVVLGDAEIFGVSKLRRTIRRQNSMANALVLDLNPGDFVVHVEHGIGKFTGTGRSPRDEGEREYLILQYAADDKLYVPMDHIERVSPFVAPLDQTPSLTRLGTQEWERTKTRVAQSTKEMASELLSLYAKRDVAEGHPFLEDTPWQSELEDSFPYEETADQKDTIREVKTDMESITPMDRLVCGDVGYGKTEVALRATFKAVMDGKQVAVLVPTTVLAQQHFLTFTERFKAYPIRLEVLSRFRTTREQEEIVKGLVRGTIDVCIGTHRLLQKDIRMKNLGLVIIDEEQRFGVSHKERLKQMRQEVDVLTMTATPIPRTLHLSLSGIRDMSTIETPPDDRLPIKTYVSEISNELIREAIRREIDRQGQVFFLHNRVHNIDYMADQIRELVPEAKVGVAHGQMPEDQLEWSMLKFSKREVDVLVCTTIIESGLDIPNVNTLIINRADTFGLSQLYQLRGRVGRGARRAYSYLLVPNSKSISEPAEKRLKTMLAATELGSGFRIAMKDLEIRGAGNVLGSEQSGHIHSVGFDLYSRLLGEAVENLRAERSGETVNMKRTQDVPIPTSIELSTPANIPENYIRDLSTRLGVYHNLTTIRTLNGVSDKEKELRDRFGPLPWQVENLLYIIRLKVLASQNRVESITKKDDKIVLKLQDEVGGAKTALQQKLTGNVFVGNTQIRLDISNERENWKESLMRTLQRLIEFKNHLDSTFRD